MPICAHAWRRESKTCSESDKISRRVTEPTCRSRQASTSSSIVGTGQTLPLNKTVIASSLPTCSHDMRLPSRSKNVNLLQCLTVSWRRIVESWLRLNKHTLATSRLIRTTPCLSLETFTIGLWRRRRSTLRDCNVRRPRLRTVNVSSRQRSAASTLSTR